jgi:hypothetical protein
MENDDARLRVDAPSQKTPAGNMALELKIARWKHGEAEERMLWCDGDAGKLERQLREIAIEIVWAGERQLRKGRQFFYEMACGSYQQDREKEQQRRAEAFEITSAALGNALAQ